MASADMGGRQAAGDEWTVSNVWGEFRGMARQSIVHCYIWTEMRWMEAGPGGKKLKEVGIQERRAGAA